MGKRCREHMGSSPSPGLPWPPAMCPVPGQGQWGMGNEMQTKACSGGNKTRAQGKPLVPHRRGEDFCRKNLGTIPGKAAMPRGYEEARRLWGTVLSRSAWAPCRGTHCCSRPEHRLLPGAAGQPHGTAAAVGCAGGHTRPGTRSPIAGQGGAGCCPTCTPARLPPHSPWSWKGT